MRYQTMGEKRELTELETKMFEKNLKTNEAELDKVKYDLEYCELLYKKGNYQNYLEKQRALEVMIVNAKSKIKELEFTLHDCKDKLKNGVNKIAPTMRKGGK
jgi:hypothetical protein